MKKIALGLVLAGLASLTACKSQQQTYQPRPATGPTYSGPVYSGPTTGPTTGPTYYGPSTGPGYAPPPARTPAPAPRAACGGGKCG
jgi:hypothetical protein